MLPSSTNRSSIARPMAAAPNAASRASTCQADGLSRSGELRMRTFGGGLGAAGAERTDTKPVRLPGGAIECIARVEDQPGLDQRADEVKIELPERAMIHQQHYRACIAECLLERQQSGRQPWRVGSDVRVAQTDVVATLDRQLGHSNGRAFANVVD